MASLFRYRLSITVDSILLPNQNAKFQAVPSRSHQEKGPVRSRHKVLLEISNRHLWRLVSLRFRNLSQWRLLWNDHLLCGTQWLHHQNSRIPTSPRINCPSRRSTRRLPSPVHVPQEHNDARLRRISSIRPNNRMRVRQDHKDHPPVRNLLRPHAKLR